MTPTKSPERITIESEYTVTLEGYIANPGKFGGLPYWAVRYHGLSLDGCSDEVLDDEPIVYDVFYLGPEDWAAFPELSGVDFLRVWTDDQGFFHVAEETSKSLNAIHKSLESLRDDESPWDEVEELPPYEAEYNQTEDPRKDTYK